MNTSYLCCSAHLSLTVDTIAPKKKWRFGDKNHHQTIVGRETECKLLSGRYCTCRSSKLHAPLHYPPGTKTNGTVPAHLRNLLRCDREAEVLPTAGRLEHPHPSLLHLPHVGDVFEGWEAGKVDVQLHPLTETTNQLILLNRKGEMRQLHQPVCVCGWSNGWSNG